MEDYWPLLKFLRIGGPTNCKRKVLIVTNYTSDDSEIRRARTPVRFARLQSSLNTTSASIINKAKLIKLLMRCHVLSQRSQTYLFRTKFLSAERPSSLCYFNSGDGLWKKTSKPRIRAEMLDGLEDVKGVVHHQSLSYVPEVIRTELISRHHDEGTSASKRLENLCQEMLWRPAVAINTYP